MIQIVTAENRAEFRRELLEMHKQRKQLFVDQMGWALECAEGLEVDEFDAPDTVYLLDMDEASGLLASVRLSYTDRPHLMSEVFAHLCDDGAPSGPHVWEASRFCPHPDITESAARRRRLARMIAGVIEAGLLFGVDQISLVTHAQLRAAAGRAGWRLTSLGPVSGARRSEGVGAYLAPVDVATLRCVRERNALGSAPLTRYAPAERQAAAA